MLNFLWALYGASPKPIRLGIARLTRWLGRIIGVFRPYVPITAFNLFVDFSDNAAFRYLRWRGAYEKAVVSLFLSAVSLNPRSIVLDIGASYGFFSLSAAAIGRFGLVKRIYAFEPDRRSVTALGKSIRANGMGDIITLERGIVGDSDGTESLFLSTLSSTSNRTFRTETNHFSYSSVESVPSRQIDTYLKASGINPAEERFVAKLDIEGNEYRAFSGMKQLLTDAKGVLLIFEFHPSGIHEVGSTAARLNEILSGFAWDTARLRVDESWKSFDRPQLLFDELESLFQANKDKPQFAADCLLGRGMTVAATD